jgi:Skp family chaperone for outer membrane proteins
MFVYKNKRKGFKMRTLKLTATLMLLGTLTLGMAVTIDEQIAAIGAASTQEERVTLVNEFKETLSTLTAEERANAISELRANMSKSDDKLQTQTQTRERTREKSRVNQMEQTQEMQRGQQMQQNQAGSQAMQQNKIGAGAGGQGQNRFMGNK